MRAYCTEIQRARSVYALYLVGQGRRQTGISNENINRPTRLSVTLQVRDACNIRDAAGPRLPRSRARPARPAAAAAADAAAAAADDDDTAIRYNHDD